MKRKLLRIKARGMERTMAGILYGVGIGPGDPELLTLKAVRILEECSVIGIPAENTETCTAFGIARQAVPEIQEKRIISGVIPMTREEDKLQEAYQQICQKIESELKAGENVAFLNLGDPAIYGTYMKIHKKIIEKGYKAELVSGVPSFCAVAAKLGVDIATRDESIHILPACYGMEEIENYSGTKILMKSARRFDEVTKKLEELEEEGILEAFAVANCGMKGETVYPNIHSLREQGEKGYFTTILVKEKSGGKA